MHNPGRNMSDCVRGIHDEMQDLARLAAEPWSPGDSVKAAIVRASRRLHWSFSRTRCAWYGKECAWRASEVDAARARRRELLLDRERSVAAEHARLKALLAAGHEPQ